MPYLIDGNNLIGHIPDLSLADRESRLLLVSRLRRFFVVSSDRDVRDFARQHGAKSITCADFHRELKGALREYRKAAELEKNEEPPTPLEVRQWGDIFETKK